jgi:AcrR family transcriptional regulator
MQVLKQRARSVDHKDQRRQAILCSAHNLLLTAGFDGFTMRALGMSVGLAKGTLYLYFETREAVFLALTDQKLDLWCSALLTANGSGPIRDEDWVTAFIDQAQQDPILLPLLTRLDLVIEHNISIDALISHKCHWHQVLDALAVGMQGSLSLPEAAARDAVVSVGTLLIGCAAVGQAPKLDPCLLPADVVAMIAWSDLKTNFQKNALRILAGVRAGM